MKFPFRFGLSFALLVVVQSCHRSRLDSNPSVPNSSLPAQVPQTAAPSSPLALPALESRFGKNWHRITGETAGDEKTILYIWSEAGPLLTAVEQQSVITSVTALPREPGDTVDAEELLKKLSFGQNWKDKGSIETTVTKSAVWLRMDGKLVAVSSKNEVLFLLPEEFMRRYPQFNPKFLDVTNRNRYNLRFIRDDPAPPK